MGPDRTVFGRYDHNAAPGPLLLCLGQSAPAQSRVENAGVELNGWPRGACLLFARREKDEHGASMGVRHAQKVSALPVTFRTDVRIPYTSHKKL